MKDDILKTIKSNEHSVIQKYLKDYGILLQSKIDQFTTELTTLSSACPSTLPTVEMIDERLKEFVRLHHLDLIRAINYQINKLKDIIYEKQLLKQLSHYYLTTEDV